MARRSRRNPAKLLLLGYRRLSLRAQFLVWAIILVALILIFPQALSLPRILNRRHTATLYFTHPADDDLMLDHTFPLELRLRTEGEAVNAVTSRFNLDPGNLEIVSMTTEHSFCSFYTENSFDTISGEVSISCGTPYPGFQGDSVVVRLIVRPKSVGTVRITPDAKDVSVLANDGHGTDILQAPPTTTLTVKQTF